MAKIRVTVEAERSMMVFDVVGNLTADEIIAEVTTRYRASPSRSILWDLTNASIADIPTDDFRRVANAALTVSDTRQGGRTAYVGSDAITYGLTRMYSTIAEVTGVPAQYGVFRTREEAIVWLAQGATPPEVSAATRRESG